MTEICGYQGLVQPDQAGPSGALRADAAASIVADALHAFLALRLGVERGQGNVAAAALTAISLERTGSSAPRAGDLVSCSIDAGAEGLAARLAGPDGVAWQAAIRLGAELPGAARDLAAAPPAGGMPPMRILRPMRKRHCDQAGHVNVQVFMDLVDEAAGVLCLQARQDAPRPQIVQARISFKQELFEGDVAAVRSGIRAVGAQGIDVVHGIVHQPSGVLACVFETRIAALEWGGRPAACGALPPIATDEVGDWTSLPPARPPALPRAPAQPAPHAVTTVLAVVDAWDADDAGWMTMRAMIDLCSTGARQYLARIGLGGARFLREKITVAAVDYLVDVRQRPRLGCNLEMRTAYLSGSARSIRFSHHIMDADEGTLYATVEIVGVMLDLATHRSMEVPQDVRQRLGLGTA